MTSGSVRAQIAERFIPVLLTDGSGWIDAETLLSSAEPTQLDAMLAVHRRSSRGHTDTAAGSLLLLDYARLLSWPVVAARLLDGATLDPNPANIALRPGDLQRGALAFRRPPTAPPTSRDAGAEPGAPTGPGELDDVAAGVVDHLEQLGEAIRRRVRIGRRTVLGDIASVLAGGLLALSWMYPPRDRYLALATDVVESHPRLQGLTSLGAIQHDDQPWMVAWRRACCLAFGDTATRSYCGTCPIVAEDDRIERFHRTADRYLTLTRASSPTNR